MPAVPRLAVRTLKVLIAVGLLAALYSAADWRSVARCLAALNPHFLTLALVLFVPQTLVSAWRWRAILGPLHSVDLSTAVRHTLASSATNLIVPAKLGDFSKAAMLPLTGAGPRARASGLVVIEKLADVASLLTWLALGTWLVPHYGLAAAVGGGALVLMVAACVFGRRITPIRDPRFALSVCGSSMLLWALHLAQIQAFLWSADVCVSWSLMAARVPWALFAGLVPISPWGMGTRDSVLVWLFADVASASSMAVVGLLTSLRYLVPGAVGIPFLSTLHDHRQALGNQHGRVEPCGQQVA